MAETYALKVFNSTTCGDFCVYQTNDGQREDIRSLTWFGKSAGPRDPPDREDGGTGPP